MNITLPPITLGWIIALLVLVVAFISLFVNINIDQMKFLIILICFLALARLT